MTSQCKSIPVMSLKCYKINIGGFWYWHFVPISPNCQIFLLYGSSESLTGHFIISICEEQKAKEKSKKFTRMMIQSYHSHLAVHRGRLDQKSEIITGTETNGILFCVGREGKGKKERWKKREEGKGEREGREGKGRERGKRERGIDAKEGKTKENDSKRQQSSIVVHVYTCFKLSQLTARRECFWLLKPYITTRYIKCIWWEEEWKTHFIKHKDHWVLSLLGPFWKSAWLLKNLLSPENFSTKYLKPELPVLYSSSMVYMQWY